MIRRYPISNPAGIFTMDEDGYYVYDSRETPVKKVEKGWGSLKTYTLEKVFEHERGKYTNVLSAQERLPGGFWPFENENFFHGMKFSFDFSLLRDGMAQKPQGGRAPMVFEFQGDDDVWVYLTDLSDDSPSRLVLDVGGDHNSMKGVINFATGEITYGKTSEKIGSGSVVYGQEDAVKAYLYRYEDWHKENSNRSESDFQWEYPLGAMNLPRKDLAQYRLDFYYLERGGTASNCYLRFNTPVVEKQKVTVVSDNESLRDGTYSFDLLVGGEEQENLQVKVQNGYGTATSEKEYAPGTDFTLKEVDPKGAVRTEWLDSAENVVSDGLEANGTIGDTTLLMCVNYYDDLVPQISKEANLNGDKGPGYYDLVLGVDGASTTITAEGGKEETYRVKGIQAYDTLSEHVDFDLDQSGKPQITLQEGSDRKTAVLTERGSLWQVSVDRKSIAEIDGKTIKWFVTQGDETLEKNQRKELHIAIQVTSPYRAEYQDRADKETGTHSGEMGYYSNVNEDAKVTYQTTIPGSEEKTLAFPKPVVRPADPSGTLTLTKVVESQEVDASEFSFDFTIQLDGIQKNQVSVTYPGNGAVTKSVTGGQLILTDIQLKDRESVVITGLNQEVNYKIEELDTLVLHF